MTKNRKILFVAPYPFGEAPSQRFRFEQYFEFLQKSGFTHEFQPFLDQKAWLDLYKTGNILSKIIGFSKGYLKRLLLMLRIGKYDFIFIHREVAPLGPPVFEWIIYKVFQKKIIYDFDDAIWLSNTSEQNKWVSGLKWHKKVASICKWSYKVSCGNDFLSSFAKIHNKNVIVIPTTIDTQNQHNPELIQKRESNQSSSKNEIVIGWTGSHSTMVYLKLIEPVLQYLEKKHSFIFRVISNSPPDLNLNSLEYIKWDKNTEIEDLNRIDIGLMPLADDEWAKGKCGFKCLQYMALKIPSLISPVGVNNQLIDNGKEGFFCQTEEDWIQNIEFLIQDAILRKTMGDKGRKKVEDYYSVQSNKNKYLKLFE